MLYDYVNQQSVAAVNKLSPVLLSPSANDIIVVIGATNNKEIELTGQEALDRIYR